MATIKDRVVQSAVKLIVEPIFEADFHDCSYGFRPNRNAKMAVERIAAEIKARTETLLSPSEIHRDSDTAESA